MYRQGTFVSYKELMKKIFICLLTTLMVFGLVACNKKESTTDTTVTTTTTTSTAKAKEDYPNAKVISLSDDKVTVDGTELKEYDYKWVYDPSMEEPTYEGTEPDTSTNYVAHDIVYYPEVSADSFTLEEYDGEYEWTTHFTKEGLTDYLFGTLPSNGGELPTDMMHSADEAYKNKILHITQPGEYILEGNWNGQILIDLGDEASTDETKKVTLILNGVTVNCSVAPALIFKNVYECDNAWEDRTEAQSTIDLSNAGAKVVLIDGTENNFTGTNVYRLLKPKYKSDETTVQKKLYKVDAAFYSYMSMLIEGNTGILNVTSGFEGLDTELHLTIDGGYITVVSQDDGINVNEDGVSIFTMKNGRLTIFAGQGSEGDVIDSNGYINVDGGIILGTSPSVSDNTLDSDSGTTVSDNATVISSLSSTSESGPGGMGGFGGPGGMTPPEGFDGQGGASQSTESASGTTDAQTGASTQGGQTPPAKPNR